MRRWTRAAAALVAAATIAGCGGDTTTPSTDFTITGDVRLTGNLFTETSQAQGTRAVDDAAGLLVLLRGTNGVVDSTYTNAGRYSFTGLPPGNYEVSVAVTPNAGVAKPVRVVDRDIAAARLDVTPSAGLGDPPNPFTQSHGVGAEFTAVTSPDVEVAVLTLGMQVVWSYTDALPLGFQHVHWGSLDQSGHRVAPGMYWMRARFDGAYHYNLLFMEP